MNTSSACFNCPSNRRWLPPAALCALLACAAALTVHAAERVALPALPASSPSAADAGRAIYQQRGADGRVVFTDRPAAGLATERRWRVEPTEDEAAAAERREVSRAEADRVSERVQRSIDHQQALSNQLQIEQIRAQREADALAAERLRERDREYESRAYVVAPRRPWTRPPVMPPSPRPTPPHPPTDVKPVRPPEPMLRLAPRVQAPGMLEAER
ncbi:MAG: hypothetical protein ACKVOX_18540 [Rhizobacter sp.]